MTRARDLASGYIAHRDTQNDLTVPANTNIVVAGPVTIPNVTATGNLSVTDELTVSTLLTITGTLNIIS